MPHTIAEHEVERGYLPQGGSGLKEGEVVSATRKGLVFEYAQDGGYISGEIRVSWADVLKHAPIEALLEAAEAHEGTCVIPVRTRYMLYTDPNMVGVPQNYAEGGPCLVTIWPFYAHTRVEQIDPRSP